MGRRLVANDMLLLTTTGRRSGQPHVVPLLYLREGDRLVVIASYGGRPQHPDWYRNLRATPEVEVQLGGLKAVAVATDASPAERSAWWPRVVDAYPAYATYQARTNRPIPVVFLDLVAQIERRAGNN